MKQYNFNMDNIKFGEARNNVVLVQKEDELFLALKDKEDREISKIKVLPISQQKKLTNFFMRAFNMPLEGVSTEDLIIPESKLMEVERKIVITGENLDEKVEKAKQKLEEKFDGEPNKEREDYPRTMIYMDTSDNKFKENNMIFRLTQENETVKVTIHMDKNLKGDEKHILKFFFDKTSMPYVVHFFQEALSLKPITRPIYSHRCEYETNFGEVAIDKVKDENVAYYSIELELDKSNNPDRDAKKIAEEMELEGSEVKIYDAGTEEIYEKISGINFFEANKIEKDSPNR